MNISIAISESFGTFHLPKNFNSNARGTQWRIDLANYLKEHAVTVPREELTEETVNKNWEKGLTTNYENLYYFPSNLNKRPVMARLMIVDIDTNEPWLITTYDGAESVESIPEYHQLDDFNYHEIVQ